MSQRDILRIVNANESETFGHRYNILLNQYT